MDNLQQGEAFKPAFHITASSGWMNDPNGLFQSRQGVFHIFYQVGQGPHLLYREESWCKQPICSLVAVENILFCQVPRVWTILMGARGR